ncbi:TPA: hypothetical protein I9079_002853 [Clostridium perfringens]|uniref:hypothetical protein n=1 Tax=Clostridium perfringens TaxID=1502 RepID=UPI0013E372F2|nr:hypothetical protein [Clostridium perfringens]NGT68137.1 hypothetical protein [Clostridium perfringens]HAT4262425.1 hypothetical protein [Clostridium perfringens]
MELKDFMETGAYYLGLSFEKQQYAAGIIKGLAISEKIESDRKNKEKEKNIITK